jgi:hypothetical protein
MCDNDWDDYEQDIDDMDAARALAQKHPKSRPPELKDLFDQLDEEDYS